MSKEDKVKEILRGFHFIGLEWLSNVKNDKEYENNLQKDINKTYERIKETQK